MHAGLKVLGVTLVVLGVGIIFGAVVSVLLIFLKQATPVDLFSLPGVSVDLSQLVTGGEVPLGKTPMELVSASGINQPLNLFAHLAIMGFFVTAGYKLAVLGKQLTDDNSKTVKTT